MHSHLEFRSSDFIDPPTGDGDPQGKGVATLLSTQLPEHGFQVESISVEDWGWRIDIVNLSFPLWIGCGHYEESADGHLCFIEPSKPYVRRLLKRTETTGIVNHLANSIEQIIRRSGKAHDLRWWTDEEVTRG